MKARPIPLAKAGLPDDLDAGFHSLDGAADAASFVEACGTLRFWDRPGA